jgi:hypothetical protein
MTAVVITQDNNVIHILEESPVVQPTESNNIINTEGFTNTIVLDSFSNVIVENQVDNVIVTGLVGPTGPAGIAEEDMPYAKKVDFVSDTVMYKAEAPVGTSTSAASWRIQKIEFGIDGDVSITWADGNANFDNIWDNRSSYVFS